MSRAEWVMSALTSVYVVLTGFYAWVSYRTLSMIRKQSAISVQQLEVAKESIKQTQQMLLMTQSNAERQLRAYVSVDRAEMKISFGVPEGVVIFKNFGQTPAYDLRVWIHTWYETHPLEVELPSPPEGFAMASNLLGPGAHTIMPIPRKPPIAEQHRREIGTKAWTVYVYGEATYRDAFGVQRLTKYRLMHGGSEDTAQPDTGKETMMLKPDSAGNETS